ncbi:MAG: hypothetical protein H8E44_25350 [Planctomycetes bacterium]|nr:hypothetical protein [Planctomycetota bacterium]MBL7042910.1 hypothetical protein [Pirellulaceae bacterium]
MNLLEMPHTLSEKIERLLQPILDADGLTRPSGADEKAAWQAVLEQLADWRRDPQQLADEGVEPPTAALLEATGAVGEMLSNGGVEPPDTLITNGDGGIAFRWRSGQRAWTIELDSDGSIESSLMVHGKLVWRHSLHDNPIEVA